MAIPEKLSVGEIKNILKHAKISLVAASKIMGLPSNELTKLDNASILSLDMTQALDKHYGLKITGLNKLNPVTESTLQPFERLRQAREELNLSQSEFGEAIGLTQAGVSKFEMNMIPLRKLVLLAIEHVYNIRGEWLIYGEEPKYFSQKTLINRDMEVFEILTKLNSDDRQIWLQLGKHLSKMQWDGKVERRKKVTGKEKTVGANLHDME